MAAAQTLAESRDARSVLVFTGGDLHGFRHPDSRAGGVWKPASRFSSRISWPRGRASSIGLQARRLSLSQRPPNAAHLALVDWKPSAGWTNW